VCIADECPDRVRRAGLVEGRGFPISGERPGRLDARVLGRVRPAWRARCLEVGIRNGLHPQQGSAVQHDTLKIVGSIHTAAYNHTIGTQKSANVTVANPWEGFHIYAMEWYADRIDIFVDGQKYFTFRNEGTGSATWPFDKPQYLLINLAIGGSWGGQKGIDEGRFPHRYVVDYVRICQQR
jgi:hypothetical protein